MLGHHMSHFPWLAQQADYHMKTSDRAQCWSMEPAFLPGRWAPGPFSALKNQDQDLKSAPLGDGEPM